MLLETRRGAPYLFGVVLATLALGCSPEDAPEQKQYAQPAPVAAAAARALNAAPVINDFAVYAKNSIKVGDRARVNGKDVGVQLAGSGPFLQTGYELGISSQARADQARSILANRVLLANGSIVGDVQTSQLTDQGSTHGAVTAWVAMPAFPTAQAVSAGTANLTVNSGATTTIGAGRYATVTVNGTLKLSGGIVQMSRLVVGTSGRIEGLAAAELRVSGRISVGARSYVGPAAGVTLVARDLRIEASGKNGANGGLNETPRAVEISNDVIIRATILAPIGTILTGQRTAITGALAGKDVLVDADSTVTYESGLGSPACVPADCSDGNPCTVDTCNAGTCSHTNAASGTSCSDANACNGAETCNATGTCIAGTPPVVNDGNACTTDSCNPATGVVHTQVASGTSCADATLCNGAETCNATGTCLAGTPPVVNDGNPCTADSCNPATGVVHTPLASGTSCSDWNMCNGAETCNATGTCVAGTPPVVDDGNPCTTDSCNPSCGVKHIAVAAGTSCSDANVCNGAEICNATATCLVGTPLPLDDGNPCTADSCNPTSGVAHTPVAVGTACPDGNPENGDETCDATGTCVPCVCGDGIVDPPEECDDGNDNNEDVCTNDCQLASACPACGDPADPCLRSFCNERTGHCLTVPNDGVSCDDGDSTTTGELCVRGLCKPPSSGWDEDDLYDYELTQGYRPPPRDIEDVAVFHDDLTARMASLTRADAIEIPVIFHILENDEYPNVDDERVVEELDVANEDYGLLKLEEIRDVFQDVAGASRIRFVPAQRDPNCNLLDPAGIHRVNVDTLTQEMRDRSGGGIPPEAGVDTRESDQTLEVYGTPGWPHDKYLNVWIVPILNLQGVGGGTHLSWDDGRDGKDGVVVEPYEFNGYSTSDSTHVLSHEIGHWLNLEHPDDDSECEAGAEFCDSKGDYLCDTPTSSGSSSYCPPDERNQCVDDTPVYDSEDVDDQLENYMIGTPENCRVMFTHGQVDRMNARLMDDRSMRNSLLGSNAAVPPESDPDLWSRDGQGDVGQEPNDVTEKFYKSTDIWVRNQDDGEEIQIHENPVYRSEDEEPNWVYVRVRNKGCEEADSEDVTLYWAKASGGLRWPDPWNGDVTEPALMGDVVGTQETGDIGPGESVILKFEWYPPDPADYESFGADLAHFCLLSHIGDEPDDTDNLAELVRESNNVVWKNVSVVTDEDLETSLALPNMPQSDENGIRLADPEYMGDRASIFDWATIRVDMGPELLTRWQDGGSRGYDVDFEPSTGMVVFNTSNAEVQGLPILEGEVFVIRVIFDPYAGTDAPKVPGMDVYHLDILQTVSGYHIPMGGQEAQVKTRIPLP